jgi:GT2 family glycosyltransferase
VDASDVTIVVLNYNGRRLLEVVLPSISGQTATGFRVHVIDDGSTDDSLDYLEREWPQVAVLRNPGNLGVTASMARAIETAETTYVAMLNNDLELDPRWLEEMRGALEAHPEAASADGKMLDFYRRDRIDGAGDMVDRRGQPGRRGHGERDEGQYDEPAAIFCASGGAALYRRAAFEDVGPFDVDLEGYYEDVDWGFRAQLRGLACRYVPTAVSYHMGSETSSREPGRWAHLVPRNQLIVLAKNMPGPLLLRHGPRMLLWRLHWLALDALSGLGRRHVRGLRQGLAMLPAALRKRRAIQARRVVAPRELERLLS